MTDPVAMTPNEELARRIAQLLADAGMIARTTVDTLATQLAAGTMRQADWEQAVEPAPPPTNSGSHDA